LIALTDPGICACPVPETDRLVEGAVGKRQLLEISGDGEDGAHRAALAADREHLVRDVHGDRLAIEPLQQVRTPARAGAEIENAIVGARLQQAHGDDEVVEQLDALVEHLGAGRRKRLLPLPRTAPGARKVGLLGLLRVGHGLY
jgi:hypothetical protein